MSVHAKFPSGIPNSIRNNQQTLRNVGKYFTYNFDQQDPKRVDFTEQNKPLSFNDVVMLCWLLFACPRIVVMKGSHIVVRSIQPLNRIY